jgi:GTP pyrophosphokinase
VHTQIGHRCRGAKVNGRIIPLNKPLNTGDQVEILTSKEEQPRRDWMNANLGYITTSRARAKVAHWFKQLDRDKNEEAGRQIIEREFKRLAIDMREVDMQRLAAEVNYRAPSDVWAALGAGDLRLSQILNAAQRQVDSTNDEQLDLELPLNVRESKKKLDSGIRILGVGNLMTTIASCCKPVPGDPIVGYITQGRGVSIHREDCTNLMSLRETEPYRMVSVDWGEEGETTYPVDILIEAYDRSGLLKDVMMILANENLNILAANTLTDKHSNIARLSLTIEISRLELLGRIMDKINQLPNVVDVHRQRSGFNS